MTTIALQLGVATPNTQLPIIRDLLRTGLLGFWDFGGAAPSLVDLSGNGNALTIEGSPPTFTGLAAVCSALARYKTPIYERASITYMGVARPQQSQVSTASRFMISNFATTRGSSLYLSENVSTDFTRGNGQVVGRNPSGGATANSTASGTSHEYEDRSNFRFFAFVIDYAANQTRFYDPAQSLDPIVVTLSSGFTLADRVLTNDDGGLLRLGGSLGSAAGIELGDAGIWDGARSTAEVLSQWTKSKDHWLGIRTIDLAAAYPPAD